MSKKRGLGKGLEELLGDSNISKITAQKSQTILIKNLIANPYQPRKQFDDSAISTLADSIKQHGVIQPLAVRPSKSNNQQYEIIAGERRFRAAKKAGLLEVPVVIHDVTDEDSAIFALVENLQREDLNAIEKAKGIQRLREEFSLTHEECGKILAQSRSSISNTLRLLELAPQIQKAVTNKEIDMGHARALLPVEYSEQSHLLKQIQLNGLSVRETEALVRKHVHKDSATEKKRNTKTNNSIAIEKKLRESFGVNVKITENKNGSGKMTFTFDNNETLDKLYKKLCGDNYFK